MSRTAPQVVFGPGVIEAVPDVVARHGKRVLVCTDTFLSATASFQWLLDKLDDCCESVTLFDQAEPELPLSLVAKVEQVGRASHIDVVLGYGGGSVIDLAKVAAVVITLPGDVERFYGEQMIKKEVIPVIAVPTTAGSGSEVTPVAVIGDHRRDLKVAVSSDRIIPVAAVVDPDLIVGCPPTVIAHSGADAICHAVEAFTARRFNGAPAGLVGRVFIGKNDYSDRMSTEAIALLTAALLPAVTAPGEIEALRDMSLGSLLAGMAFANAGTTAAHALQYPLGALTKTSHGLGVGLLLPYALVTAIVAREHELATVASLMGLPPEGDRSKQAQSAVRALRSLMVSAGLPSSLSEIGVQRSDLPGLANRALKVTRLLNNHATTLSRDQILAVYAAAYRGGDPIHELRGAFAT